MLWLSVRSQRHESCRLSHAGFGGLSGWCRPLCGRWQVSAVGRFNEYELVDPKIATNHLNNVMDSAPLAKRHSILVTAISYAYRFLVPVQQEIICEYDRLWQLSPPDQPPNHTLLRLNPATQTEVEMPEVPMEDIFWIMASSEGQLRERFAQIAAAVCARKQVRMQVMDAVRERIRERRQQSATGQRNDAQSWLQMARSRGGSQMHAALQDASGSWSRAWGS